MLGSWISDSTIPRFLIPWSLIVPGIRILKKLRNHHLKGSFSLGGNKCFLSLINADALTWRVGDSGGAGLHTSVLCVNGTFWSCDAAMLLLLLLLLILLMLMLVLPSAKPKCQAHAIH